MGLLAGEDEFRLGLALIHSRLRDAISEYETYLIVYGTVPNMALVEELKKLSDKVLTHDLEKGKEVIPFKHSVVEQVEE